MKCVFRTNPREPQFPGRPWCVIKRSQGTSPSLVSYFSTVLQLDVRHQSLQQQPREPLQRLTENGMLLASILHTLRSFSDPMLDGRNIISDAGSNCGGSLKQINQDLNSISVYSHRHVEISLLRNRQTICFFSTMADGSCAVIWHLCLCCVIHNADETKRQRRLGQNRWMQSIQMPVNSSLTNANSATAGLTVQKKSSVSLKLSMALKLLIESHSVW